MSEQGAKDVDFAMRWLVAVEIAKRLPSSWKLSRWRPKEGFYDTLLLHPEPLGEPVSIVLTRFGWLAVLFGESASNIVHDPWHGVARGEVSVVELANQALRVLGEVSSRQLPVPAEVDGLGVTDLHVLRLLAELLRVSALFDVSCTVETARYWSQMGEFALSPSAATFEVQWVAEVELSAFPRTAAMVAEKALDPGTVWLVSIDHDSGEGRFDAAVSWSFIEFADGSQEPLSGFVDDLIHRPWQYVSILFGGRLGRALHAKDPAAPEADRPRLSGLGVPATLGAFNRKERSLLFSAITGSLDDAEPHGPALRVASWWADQLHTVTGWNVPRHAWMGIDYHLSWLHGALTWASGRAWPGQLSRFPSTGDDPAAMLVTGNQEDADVILCWAAENGPTRILVVEAKGYSAWSNKQMTSKVGRLATILAAAHEQELDIEMKLVLASPRKQKHLDVTGWPAFALGADGLPMWTQLPAPGLRLATGRCDDVGAPSAAGLTWRIKGPS